MVAILTGPGEPVLGGDVGRQLRRGGDVAILTGPGEPVLAGRP